MVDVRTEKEFDTKHIKNAINIDWKSQNDFEAKVLQLDKNKPVYVYCQSGNRSGQAAKRLTELGFNVYDIEGGVMKWEASELPLEKTKKSVSSGLSEQDYLNILKENNIVLVDFQANWCIPCKELTPIIDDIAKTYEGKVKVLKINIDDNKDLVKKLNVQGLPTLFIYHNGQKTWEHQGLVKQRKIEKHLKVK